MDTPKTLRFPKLHYGHGNSLEYLIVSAFMRYDYLRFGRSVSLV